MSLVIYECSYFSTVLPVFDLWIPFWVPIYRYEIVHYCLTLHLGDLSGLTGISLTTNLFCIGLLFVFPPTYCLCLCLLSVDCSFLFLKTALLWPRSHMDKNCHSSPAVRTQIAQPYCHTAHICRTLLPKGGAERRMGGHFKGTNEIGCTLLLSPLKILCPFIWTKKGSITLPLSLFHFCSSFPLQSAGG